MVKLIIQIPCYNEEQSLPITLQALPRELPGCSSVEWLVIDDGSSDRTAQVARENGAHHVVRHLRNLGLARAFMTGVESSLSLGADIILNTDADNQYVAADIPRLIAPILAGEADMVIGSRPIASIAHFSWIKKVLQKFGSWMVRYFSRTSIQDTTSGFRAFSRAAASQLHVFNEYTYTLETIIQAGQKGMAIVGVPVRVNAPMRPSRLIPSIPVYLIRSIITILRIFMVYQPFVFFVVPGVFSFLAGALIGVRFLYFYLTAAGSGHVQSLILAAVLLLLGVFLGVTGLLADLISVNRKLLERLESQLHAAHPDRGSNDRGSSHE